VNEEPSSSLNWLINVGVDGGNKKRVNYSTAHRYGAAEDKSFLMMVMRMMMINIGTYE
jgi:hypothetical protein